MLKKIQRRFILAAMTAFALVMLVLIAGINLLNHYQLTRSQDQKIQGILEYDRMIRSQPAAEHPPIHEMPWAGGPEAEFTTRFFVVHCSEEGKIRVFGNDYISSVDEETAEAYVRDVLMRQKTQGNYKDFRYAVSRNREDLVMVFLNVADAAGFKQTLLFVSLLIGLISLGAVFVLVLLLSRQAIRPYLKNVERQKRFITDASHELKTPITSIATSADIIAMEQKDNEWVHNIQQQTLRLARLVNDLVTLSRLDEEMPFPEKSSFSLSEAAWEIAEPFTAMAKASGKKYTQNIDEELTFCGDRSALQQMLSILLDNAFKYTAPDGEIHLSVTSRRGKIVIELSNTCSLQDTGELSRLFDRFYRPDTSRSTHTGGYGLGLSIAQAIAASHGGTITAHAKDKSTILFRVVL